MPKTLMDGNMFTEKIFQGYEQVAYISFLYFLNVNKFLPT